MRWRDEFEAAFEKARRRRFGLLDQGAAGPAPQGSPEAPEAVGGEAHELIAALLAENEALRADAEAAGSPEAVDGEAHELIAALLTENEALRAGAEAAGSLRELLLEPGFRMALVKAFHPDAHPHAGEDQRRLLTGWAQKINAIYARLDNRRPAA